MLATPEGTAAYARDHPGPGWRAWRGLTLSSVGFGSYLGDDTDESDRAYADAFALALRSGVNVLDTAANYRGRRSERAIGAAIREAGVPRERFLVATKAGFVPFERDLAQSPRDYFDSTYVATGVATHADLVAGCHVMTPAYLAHELERSLEGLGLDAVDVLFLHNPETQLETGVRWPEFEHRLRACFAWLETQRAEGRIGAYGLATWNGLRRPPDTAGHLPLEAILALAREAGGEDHGLRALELPYNLGMPEAATAATQPWKGRRVPVLRAAQEAGLLVLGSATLLQGQLLKRMPDPLRQRLGATPLEAAIQFSRSTPGMTTALVGTGRPEHAEQNLAVLSLPPRVEAVGALLGAG